MNKLLSKYRIQQFHKEFNFIYLMNSFSKINKTSLSQSNSKLPPHSQPNIKRKLSLCKYQTIQSMQGDVRHTFKQSMNQFIQNKLRIFTLKRQQELLKNQIPNNFKYLSNTQIHHHALHQNKQEKIGKSRICEPIIVQKMRICEMLGKVEQKTQKMVAEPYVVNNKEKISRIISLRMEQQDSFNKMKKNIRDLSNSRCRQKNKEQSKLTEVEQLVNQHNQKMQAEKQRYRKRLLTKHRKKFSSTIAL